MPMILQSRPFLGEYTWAALQSEFPNGSAALAALPKSMQVSVVDLEDATFTPNSTGAYWRSRFTLAQAGLGTPGIADLVVPNSAITWTLDADPANGKTRLLSSAAHGITSTNNGRRVKVLAWSGSGVAGFFALTYVDATHIDIAVAYSAGAGNPTIVGPSTNADSALCVVHTIPAGLLQAHSVIEVSSVWNCTNSAPAKYAGMYFGGDAKLMGSINSSAGLSDGRHIRARGSKTAQISPPVQAGSGFGGGSPRIGTTDTNNAVDIAFGLRADVADAYIELGGYSIVVSV